MRKMILYYKLHVDNIVFDIFNTVSITIISPIPYDAYISIFSFILFEKKNLLIKYNTMYDILIDVITKPKNPMSIINKTISL